MQPSRTPHAAEPTEDIAVDEVLSLLADDYAQSILDTLADGEQTATAIADRCEASTVTIYRRLNRLETVGLVTTTTQIAADGNHRTTYHARPASVAISISEDGLTGDLTVASAAGHTAGGYGPRPASTMGDD